MPGAWHSAHGNGVKRLGSWGGELVEIDGRRYEVVPDKDLERIAGSFG